MHMGVPRQCPASAMPVPRQCHALEAKKVQEPGKNSRSLATCCGAASCAFGVRPRQPKPLGQMGLAGTLTLPGVALEKVSAEPESVEDQLPAGAGGCSAQMVGRSAAFHHPSLHKRPIEPRGFSVTSRVKEQIRAGRQIGQEKQIYPVGARQIGAVLHEVVVAQRAIQIEQRIPCP